MRLSFGRCVLDTETRQVTVSGHPVHLTPKMFELLLVLLETRPRAIAKSELLQRIWPETFVADAAISNLVADLRAAIGDDARDPGLIRTIHRYGYAFSGKVSTAFETATTGAYAYRLLWEAREVALREGENLLGRSPDSIVWVEDPDVSRRHARITVHAEEVTLEDLESRNGTFLNGQRIGAIERLADGDSIRLGGAVLTFRAYYRDVSTRTTGQ